MTNNEAKVLNTKSAMSIIISEAKKLVAAKFETTVDMVDFAISAKNENVISMMRKLVGEGVKQTAEAL
jgi:hypothetical protein